MNAVGVIVEYNPFHNGHAYHLKSAKEKADADVVIAVMSGNFLQRGEPAIVSKWTRARMALSGGADLVFELPYQFATQQAETFAEGAISILDGTGCQSFCFGSEDGQIHAFYQTLAFLEEHEQTFQAQVKQQMGLGVSYPKALALSFQGLSPSDSLIDLSKPNNILGFQYIKAAVEQKSSMRALTVKRKSADYHDEHFSSSTIASATSIRKALFNGSSNTISSKIEQYLPHSTFHLLNDYHNQYGLLHRWENYWPFLKYRLIQSTPFELQEIYEMEEGLENRFISSALNADSFSSFMNLVKTKRYTWTRLQRICVHILTGTKKHQMLESQTKVSYLRLLGMTAIGKQYLNKRKKQFNLPLISKLSSFDSPEIKLDIRASRIYSLAIPGKLQLTLLKQEFTQPPIFLERDFSQD